ncbi:MAG: exodeoxyribonuclease VII large subunit [Candidatus Sumerlaeaceae bacterium]
MRDATAIANSAPGSGLLDQLMPDPASGKAPAGKPLSVTELTGQIRNLLEVKFAEVLVEGEISGMRPAASGHCYFTLKDATAQVSCVLWAADAARLGKKMPRDGDKVEITGRLSVYAQRGNYQIVVSKIRPAGLGRLFMAFNELKERLEKEGLFAAGRKRPIPQFPKKIGIVTSPTGAAIRDILKVLSRRAPHIEVVIWPARVQGDGAAREIAHGINRLNARNAADVLIVGRGGGSLEDLWAFNEEVVARAIYKSAIPVISAVGHEIDFTIADFVADYRAPTPSAAAEIVARNSNELLRDLEQSTARLKKAMHQRFGFLRETPHLRARLESALIPRVTLLRSRLTQFQRSHALQRPIHKLNDMRQQLDDTQARMHRGLSDRNQHARQLHARLSAHLNALNPKAILGRGYSITFDAQSGVIVRHADETAAGQPLRIVLSEGAIDANVAGSALHMRPALKRRGSKQPVVIEWFGDVEPAPPKG